MKEKKKVVALGEMLLRLTTEPGRLIPEADYYSACYGGGECNVLVSLAHLGYECTMLTRLPHDALGDACIKYLRSNMVSSDYIVRDKHTLGIYFVDVGEGPRPSNTVYNRNHSAAVYMHEKDFDFDTIFKDCDLFYVTGITLAISEGARRTALEAMKKAKEHGVKIAFDFNYRSKLWTVEEAKKVYHDYVKYADIVFASKWDFETLLGISSEGKNENDYFRMFCDMYNFEYIFTKKRKILNARSQMLQALCYTKDSQFEGVERKFDIFDRIGAGDAFAAGVLDVLLKEPNNIRKATDYGIANSIMKQTIYGDASRFEEADLDEFLKTNGEEEVKR